MPKDRQAKNNLIKGVTISKYKDWLDKVAIQITADDLVWCQVEDNIQRVVRVQDCRKSWILG